MKKLLNKINWLEIRILKISFFFSVTFTFAQKTEKVYFFGDHDFIASNTQLVVFVKDPQTQIAKDIGQKIYFDTAELRILQNASFEREIPTSKLEHFCGVDVFLFLKNGQNIQFLYSINSECSIDGFSCDLMHLLDSLGSHLKKDSVKSSRKNILKLTNSPSSFIYGPYSKELITNFNFKNYYFNKNGQNLRPQFYDGYYVDSINVKEDNEFSQYPLYTANYKEYIESLPLTKEEKLQIGLLNELNYSEESIRRKLLTEKIEIRVYLSEELFKKLNKPNTTWIPQASNDKYYWVFRPIATNK